MSAEPWVSRLKPGLCVTGTGEVRALQSIAVRYQSKMRLVHMSEDYRDRGCLCSTNPLIMY